MSFVLRPADGIGGGSGCVSDAEAARRSSSARSSTGGAGSPRAPTSAAGARWCTARRSPSSCSPSSRRGAIVAAATCSLPEELGGERNWDYRYTWIRDAAFTMYAFMRIGFTEEAGHFMDWLERALPRARPRRRAPDRCTASTAAPSSTRRSSTHLDGYRGSRPVRIGNGALQQLQLDIYGELMDSVYLYNKYGTPISYDLWHHLRRLTNWVCDNWHGDGRRHLGGPRRPAPLRLLQADVLGGRRPRACASREKRSFPADRAALDRRCATRSTRRSWRTAGASSGRRSCRPTAATASTPRP